MSERQLRRRLRELKKEHRILMDELFEITDSPKGIEHFEDHYLRKGASLETIKRRLDGMSQFPRAVKNHILHHFEIKHEIRGINKKLWRIR